MADKNLLRTGNSTIEAYRSSDAAPDNWEDAKFWLINELRRIQNGFYSVDDVIANLSVDNISDETRDTIIQNITNIIETPEGPGAQGPAGPPGADGADGADGQDGDAGDLIADWKTALDFTWSSQKIAEELAAVGVGGDNSISIGPTPPASPDGGDLWFENQYTLELYVWDGQAWISTTGAGPEGPAGPAGPQGPTGPQGPEGPEAATYTSPSFTYNVDLELTRIDYSEGNYKILAYNVDGQLVTSTFYDNLNVVLSTKTFTYNLDGTLDFITET